MANSNERFINNNKLSKIIFSWQKPVSAFSVSKSDANRMCLYFFNQPEHYKKESFAREYEEFKKIINFDLKNNFKIQF